MAFWDADGVGYFFPPPKPNSENDNPKWESFREYHSKHPEIWEQFVQKTFEAWDKGFRKIGSHFIIQQIRWEGYVHSSEEKYKVGNNHFPYYARKFMTEYPKYEGIFELRRLKSL